MTFLSASTQKISAANGAKQNYWRSGQIRAAVFVLTAWAALCADCSALADAATNSRHVSFYSGVESSTRLMNIMTFDIDPVDTYIASVCLGQRLWTDHAHWEVEVEAQFSKFFGQHVYQCDCEACVNEHRTPAQNTSRRQQHEEFNLVLVVKWLTFPWDRYLDTSFSVGEGISYATEPPPCETDYHAMNNNLDYQTSKVLNYLLFDLGVKLPWMADATFFFRVHHRSGVYGLIKGIYGGSNFVGFGVRFDF